MSPSPSEPVPSKNLSARLHEEAKRGWHREYAAFLESCADEMDQLRTALRGIQSCGTCEACRGAATLALGGAAPEPMSEICKQLRALPGGYRLLGYTAAQELERLSRPAHEREGPHCSTCACGLAPEPHVESQCWEPCGELGKSEAHARVASEPFPDPDVGAKVTAEEPEASNDWGVREAFKTIESYIRPGSAIPGAVLHLKREIRKLEKMVMEESARASQHSALRNDELIAWTCACAFIGLDREQKECPACGMPRPTQPPGEGQ